MSDNAYKLGRTMVWSNTARNYMGSFEMATRASSGCLRICCKRESRAVGRMKRWTNGVPALTRVDPRARRRGTFREQGAKGRFTVLPTWRACSAEATPV